MESFGDQGLGRPINLGSNLVNAPSVSPFRHQPRSCLLACSRPVHQFAARAESLSDVIFCVSLPLPHVSL